MKRTFVLGASLTTVLITIEFLFFALVFAGCSSPESEPGYGASGNGVSSLPCTATAFRPPTTSEELTHVYASRSFYADGNHLGHDVALPEGTAIAPIACGVIKVYRPASGYGQLAVVIEHELPYPMMLTNGVGDSVQTTRFLSIYGHLRKSEDRDGTKGVLQFAAGDSIGPTDTLGYVDQDATNGDGAEHLHLGIRLQSASEAMDTDQHWFRGYDGTPSQLKWYADPVLFLSELHAELSGDMCPSDTPNESGSSSSSSSSGSNGSSSGVPEGLVQFVYEGGTGTGVYELHGTWKPLNSTTVPWGPEATSQCPDVVPGDYGLECLLTMPSGTTNFTFTVKLPDGSWWGDMSYDPLGGKGDTIGVVTLVGPQGEIPYQMVSNGTGSEYYNGYVSVVP